MADEPAAALATVVSEAFGWPGGAIVETGPRGATARIWQVRVGSMRYALKEGRGTPPSPGVIAAEVDFIERALEAGVRVPALHADRLGRRIVPGPDGTWLRLYDWIETRPADPSAQATAVALGELLARLHRGASRLVHEPDGGAPDDWYERPPTIADLSAAVDSAGWWAVRLAHRIESMPSLVATATPVDPARLMLCHRDLHPGNVVVDDTGSLVVLDHDDNGPADTARELARALFDWWSDPEPDLGMIGAMYNAYIAADGPARVREPSDFTMLVASRLNFLRKQLCIAADASARADDRAWAEQEIDEALRILPTVEQLDEVLTALGA